MARRGKQQLPAAIRIPDAEAAPSSPMLFVHEGSRQALERKLKSGFQGPVVLSITDNRHSIISHSTQNEVLYVRIHHMFLGAPATTVDALVRYIVHADRDAGTTVGMYIEGNGARLAKRRPHAIPVDTKGAVHDLAEIYKDLNDRYFSGNVHVLITWGRRVPRKTKKARNALRLGSYSENECVIRIHPVLDRAWVPRYFVAAVIFHEMLHHIFPTSTGGPRRCLHPPEFLEREKEFAKHEKAVTWERTNIGRLLRT